MVAGAHAHKFFREVAKTNSVWTIGLNGTPQTLQSKGNLVHPVWSSRSRVEKIIATAQGYSKYEVLGMDWSEFERIWLKVLLERKILLGINWSGPGADGYEIPADLVAESVRAAK